MFFRLDESNCSKIQGSANFSKHSVLKECYFDDPNIKITKTLNSSLMDSDINERNGFECGESHCLRIEDFCGQGLNPFKDTFDKICPGFHFLNFH